MNTTTAAILNTSEEVQDLQARVYELTESLRHAEGDFALAADKCNDTPRGAWRTRRYNEAQAIGATVTRLRADLDAANAALLAAVNAELDAQPRVDRRQQALNRAHSHAILNYDKTNIEPYDGVGTAITHTYRKGPITIYISESDIEGGEIIEFLVCRSDRPRRANGQEWFRYFHG